LIGSNAILKQIEALDPTDYWKTRNFIDGHVTKLSPYISRGVISTKKVFKSLLDRGFDVNKIDKFIQELAWRDYWQQVWMAKGSAINSDLKWPQPNVSNFEMPSSITEAATGIEAIDNGINDFYESGYLHNHVRMYIASMACNVGGSHWMMPARWMYYHLLDGDWASNALSWQWVAGANAGKKYYANQWNINKFCYTDQRKTFLDVEYSEFEGMKIPEALKKTCIPELITPLPEKEPISIDPKKATLIYNYYNLDPDWHKEEDLNRVLLIEPSIFDQYPISEKSMRFMIDLSKNIAGIQIFLGEFHELMEAYSLGEVIFKEHPLNRYKGTKEPRDWMFNVTGYYPSFFAFWKKCKKELYPLSQLTLFDLNE
jgi:deoxyribodipyrimidine photo-lyase